MRTLYFININSICSSNYTIIRVKMKATDWEKIFVIHIVVKLFIPKMLEEKSSID